MQFQIFITSHYAGEDLLVKFEKGEEWKKVLGPVCIYLNSEQGAATADSLWKNAKQQVSGKF